MRQEIFICNHCKKIADYEPDSWLHIKTSDGNNSLCIRNDLKNRAVVSMQCHNEINFCSEKCFINFFIKTAGVFLSPEKDHREEE